MHHALSTADRIVVAGYFLLLAGIGLYFWRRMKNASDLFAGGNSVPWWLAGVSFYLTAFSAFTFVAYSEMAYRYGLIALTLTWSSALAMIVGTYLLAGRWRRARIVSPVEFLEARYSPQIRQVLAWAGLPLKLLDDGLKIYATGIFVSVGLGYDLMQSVVASGVIMSLYTFMGGLWAVVVTDYIQFIILTTGVALLFPLAFAQMGGVFEGLRILANEAPASFFSFAPEPFSLSYVAMFYLLIMISYNGNWAFAQKFYSVRTEKDARKAGLLATFLKIAGPPLFILPAMAARHLLPELAVPPNSPQYTYAALSLKYLPPGLVGLMIAAMFSATMSTLSGDFNVMASVITKDIYQRLVDRNATERRLVLVGRLATLFVGTATVAIGTFLVSTRRANLFELMVKLFGLFVGPMLLPMLVGLVSRKVTWRGAAAGIAAGFATGGGLQLYRALVLEKQAGISSSWLRYDFEAINIAATFAMTLGAMALVTLLQKTTVEEQQRIDSFFARLDQPIRKRENSAAGNSPFSPIPVIGLTTVGVGALLLVAAATLTEGSGRLINVGAGLFFCVFGGACYALAGRSAAFRKMSEDAA